MRKSGASTRGSEEMTNRPTSCPFPVPATLRPRSILGDIAIAYETVAREAQDQGKPLSHHLCHMIVHGFLHLLGYDHETDEEAEAMEADEISALRKLGIADPYGEHAEPGGC